ncbi:FAD-dependent tricarballylate dehydrogenase TcuA [Rhodovulum sulfidophilum]|uniref:FAD-dependent tricarballylate dehydrogenase TcuA n=1 Tax=Rhodovulum sulfidophilum TaxID=35806 RepID=UPI0019294D6C|nr:FAD-dependent tricarballylate dehydrogenase TcuA [Rhodovulum sulfidophilum]MBL3585215.1 FAD-dependent tricarballylate dehydrogenase TcuA [Rhodovulum sulfidophilum]
MPDPRPVPPVPGPSALPGATGVLVAGAGFAGLTAAIEARLRGAEVTLIDPAPMPLWGGNTRHSRNIRLAHDSETRWQRGSYPAAEFAADIERLAPSDTGLAGVLARGSADLGSWLAARGVAFEPWDEGNLPFSRRTAFFRGGGQALSHALLRAAGQLGVRIASGRIEALPPDWAEDRPLCLTVQTADGARSLQAEALVLTTGGYGANPDEMIRHLGPGAAAFANRGTPHQDGAPLLWLMAHGAATVGRPGDGHLVAVDARAPASDAGIVSRADGMQFGLVVDAAGQRFRDEGTDVGSARYSVWGRALAERADPRAWLILDAEGTARLPPLLYPPLTAENPADLARLCGIEPGGLAATLEALAAHLDRGTPLEPPRSRPEGVPFAPPLRPPLAAIPLRPGLTFTRHGVAVDATARVRLAEGGSAHRVFAAGASMAGALLGQGYLSGTALAIGGVFGRIAGAGAASLADHGVGQAGPATDKLRQASAVPALQPAPPQPAAPAPEPEPEPWDEAARALNICNTCGFCTGLCAVFPAARLRPALGAGDLRHLAHLCHDCRSCHYDCQYAPPHALAVNLPAALAEARAADYAARLPARLPQAVFLLCLLGLPLMALLAIPPERLFAAGAAPGAFYEVIPHGLMAGGAGLAFGGAALVLAIRLWRFWRQTAGPAAQPGIRALARGLGAALRLTNLGEARGCDGPRGPTGPARRIFHHLLAGGFVLTGLATLAGAVLHAGGEIAPYPLASAPVALGTLGGIAMLAGLAGLSHRRKRADRRPASARMEAADRDLRRALGIVAGSGLALLALRDGPAMGLMLALHLGAVLGLALALPFGKLSHGAYRSLALIRHAAERAARPGPRR